MQVTSAIISEWRANDNLYDYCIFRKKIMKYNTFLWVFIISILSGIVFLIFYMQAIFSVVAISMHEREPNPFAIFAHILNPAVLISLLVAIVTGLAYRIMGIVCVAKNKTVSDGERAIWIIGFILLGFVTAIVFLILAKSKKLVKQENV